MSSDMNQDAKSQDPAPSIHASAVLIGNQAALIRGPSGSGKSRLAFDLIVAGRAGQIPATTLVGDDRIHLALRNSKIIARAAPGLTGLIEIRGLGVRRCDFTAEAQVSFVVDLAADDGERMPPPEAFRTTILGIEIPRIPVGSGFQPLPLVIAALLTGPGSAPHPQPSNDCRKDFGNHISATLATE